jgi:DNA-directed RNA polymerase specialized sigma24 family protein
MADGLDDVDADKAQRFRDAALPNLDSLYTFARYLLRSADDAEDAVQECYLRAFRHYDGFRGGAIKPWLMAILQNVCRAEFARRASNPLTTPRRQPPIASCRSGRSGKIRRRQRCRCGMTSRPSALC